MINQNIDYKNKYLKYKQKYFNLLKGGTLSNKLIICIYDSYYALRDEPNNIKCKLVEIVIPDNQISIFNNNKYVLLSYILHELQQQLLSHKLTTYELKIKIDDQLIMIDYFISSNFVNVSNYLKSDSIIKEDNKLYIPLLLNEGVSEIYAQIISLTEVTQYIHLNHTLLLNQLIINNNNLSILDGINFNNNESSINEIINSIIVCLPYTLPICSNLIKYLNKYNNTGSKYDKIIQWIKTMIAPLDDTEKYQLKQILESIISEKILVLIFPHV